MKDFSSTERTQGHTNKTKQYRKKKKKTECNPKQPINKALTEKPLNTLLQW